MKKPFYKNFLFLAFIIFCLVVVVLYIVIHRPHKFITPSILVDASSTPQEQLIENKDKGYSFSIPKTWYEEESSSNTIAIYPNYSPNVSSSPMCKIEMSIFPYASSTNISDWISARISADPTLDVKEQSSEDIPIGATSGIEWAGTIDGAPTTLVYAFTNGHAYEIAPSTLGGASTDVDQCGESMDIFLKKLTIQ